MLVQAQVVPWWGTGRPAEFSPSGTNPSRASPTGRRIGGYDYKTEAIQGPRADNYTHFREMKFRKFPLAQGWICSDRVEQIGSADPSVPPVPGTESLLEIWLGRSNRSRAGLAGSWTTRVQARRVRADPTADRKPKACQ